MYQRLYLKLKISLLIGVTTHCFRNITMCRTFLNTINAHIVSLLLRVDIINSLEGEAWLDSELGGRNTKWANHIYHLNAVEQHNARNK
jgi:hypothetical protein